MPLIEDLRTAVDTIPPSHVPANATDAIGLVGAVIAYLEHGEEKFIGAVRSGGVAGLFKDAEQLEAEASAPKSIEDATAEIAALKAQLAAAQGVAQQTTVGPVVSTPAAPGVTA